MPGTKGHSGGKRDGAGRKAKIIKIVDGQEVHVYDNRGVEMHLWVTTAHIVDKNTIELLAPDGKRFDLVL